MNKPKIEKRIPIPSSKTSSYSWLKELNIGDSFLLKGNINSLRVCLSKAAKTNNVQLASRKTAENEIRFWRIQKPNKI